LKEAGFVWEGLDDADAMVAQATLGETHDDDTQEPAGGSSQAFGVEEPGFAPEGSGAGRHGSASSEGGAEPGRRPRALDGRHRGHEGWIHAARIQLLLATNRRLHSIRENTSTLASCVNNFL